MKKINDGGPAFPSTTKTYEADNGDQMHMGANGMTLRDYFAAKLMVAVWSVHQPLNDYDCAKRSYEMADAMLRAREAS